MNNEVLVMIAFDNLGGDVNYATMKRWLEQKHNLTISDAEFYKCRKGWRQENDFYKCKKRENMPLSEEKSPNLLDQMKQVAVFARKVGGLDRLNDLVQLLYQAKEMLQS